MRHALATRKLRASRASCSGGRRGQRPMPRTTQVLFWPSTVCGRSRASRRCYVGSQRGIASACADDQGRHEEPAERPFTSRGGPTWRVHGLAQPLGSLPGGPPHSADFAMSARCRESVDSSASRAQPRVAYAWKPPQFFLKNCMVPGKRNVKFAELGLGGGSWRKAGRWNQKYPAEGDLRAR